MRDETANKGYPLVDGLMVEVAAQLLVAPPIEHLLDGLGLRMQQRNRAHQEHATALIDRQTEPPSSLV
ncbi:hypothetical protein OKHIL_47580 [Mycolicibacterium mageritense]|nr:hypothetical protein MTY414_71670 [Mycolicibacterium mageritense]